MSPERQVFEVTDETVYLGADHIATVKVYIKKCICLASSRRLCGSRGATSRMQVGARTVHDDVPESCDWLMVQAGAAMPHRIPPQKGA